MKSLTRNRIEHTNLNPASIEKFFAAIAKSYFPDAKTNAYNDTDRVSVGALLDTTNPDQEKLSAFKKELAESRFVNIGTTMSEKHSRMIVMADMMNGGAENAD